MSFGDVTSQRSEATCPAAVSFSCCFMHDGEVPSVTATGGKACVAATAWDLVNFVLGLKMSLVGCQGCRSVLTYIAGVIGRSSSISWAEIW